MWFGCLSALPPLPPFPPAPEAGCDLLVRGRACPAVLTAQPTLFSYRQGAENSTAIPPVADLQMPMYPLIDNMSPIDLLRL